MLNIKSVLIIGFIATKNDFTITSRCKQVHSMDEAMEHRKLK